MTVSKSIELFTALNLLILGLSHFLQPKIWVDYFMFLYRKGNAGNVINALISLGIGAFVFSFYFVWTWPKMLITLYGLALLIKGSMFLVFPLIGIKSIGKITSKKVNTFKWVGLAMIFFALVIFYGLIQTCQI